MFKTAKSHGHGNPVGGSSPRALDFLSGGGEMGTRIREFDWAKSPIGPAESWPQSLRSAVSILLPSRAQIVLFWGPELVTLYNDAYRPVFGGKHPRALGLPVREAWNELWGAGLKELLEGVLATGEAFWASDRLFVIERHGYTEETFFDVSYDPVRDESGKVGGVFCIVNETTVRVLGARRLRTLRDLSARTTTGDMTVTGACQTVSRIFAENAQDTPFTLTYLLRDDGASASLCGASGLRENSVAAPTTIALDESGWQLGTVAATRRALIVADVKERFGEIRGTAWPEPVTSAVVLPIAKPGQEGLAGVLVAGVNPRRALDESYRDFLDLAAGHVGAAIANAKALEEEKRRVEALAEIDRAKTAFFSNVSHEFRTPLTLMLGPLEDALANVHGILPPGAATDLEVAHRNARRLLKLVNTLLDFSRIEADRVQASFEAVDLAEITTELASVFRSAIERAGLTFTVDCPPLAERVYVDREMWEKIVLNLLSNAFKFTFTGEIKIKLRSCGDHVELSVTDTGIGIATDQLPRVFERFHRVPNIVRARTHEGSGIGLALVQELARLHGGEASVESKSGSGSRFIISIPHGSTHLPAERTHAERAAVSTGTGAQLFLEEALRWLPEEPAVERQPTGADFPASRGAGASMAVASALPTAISRILLADDNADMRDYVSRLLRQQGHEVVAVMDGESALAAAHKEPPDLILSDVMMPRLNGFELLRQLRADATLKTLPVILLSARAGEESRVEGLAHGADDYLIKPFSARELTARVATHLELARVRRQAVERIRESESLMMELKKEVNELCKRQGEGPRYDLEGARANK